MPEHPDTAEPDRRPRRRGSALALANERLRLLSARLVDADERERARIARELHDGLGQVLTSLLMHLHAGQCSADATQAEHCFASARALAKQAIRAVKSMAFELRPAQLELLGFVAAVKAMLDRTRDATGLDCVLRVRGQAPHRTLPAHAVALRILREALNNVLHHAAARQLVVRLRFGAGDRFALAVADDGRGYDVSATLAGGLNEANLGLYGMLERVELLGGRIRFRSSRGRGTVVRLTL